jgi:hypothetical protein
LCRREWFGSRAAIPHPVYNLDFGKFRCKQVRRKSQSGDAPLTVWTPDALARMRKWDEDCNCVKMPGLLVFWFAFIEWRFPMTPCKVAIFTKQRGSIDL